MPLDESGSRESVSKNIATEMRAGRPQAQAVAIALDVRRRARAKKGKQMDKKAFVSGFTNACLAEGVDPDALLKDASAGAAANVGASALDAVTGFIRKARRGTVRYGKDLLGTDLPKLTAGRNAAQKLRAGAKTSKDGLRANARLTGANERLNAGLAATRRARQTAAVGAGGVGAGGLMFGGDKQASAFDAGFVQACRGNGVDPDELIKAAQALDPNSLRYRVSKDLGGDIGMSAGALAGGALGGAEGALKGGLAGGVTGGALGAWGGGKFSRAIAERAVKGGVRPPRIPGAKLPGKYKLLAAVLGTLGFAAGGAVGGGIGAATGGVAGAASGAVKGGIKGGRLGEKYGPMSVV